MRGLAGNDGQTGPAIRLSINCPSKPQGLQATPVEKGAQVISGGGV